MKQRFHAKHHPFTSPKKEDMKNLDSDPASVRANAYDLVLNGKMKLEAEVICIHDKNTRSNV